MSHSNSLRDELFNQDVAVVIMWWWLIGKKIINILLRCWFFLLNHTDFRHGLRTGTVGLSWGREEQWIGSMGWHAQSDPRRLKSPFNFEQGNVIHKGSRQIYHHIYQHTFPSMGLSKPFHKWSHSTFTALPISVNISSVVLIHDVTTNPLAVLITSQTWPISVM